MRKVDQTRFGKGEGNCLAACVASITEIPLDLLALNWTSDEHWYETLQREMARHGWTVEYDTAEVPRGYCIASGDAARGVTHSVVYFDGTLVHDPHPSRDGLLNEQSYITLTRSANANG